MDRHVNLDWVPLLLVPAAFLASIATWIFAFLDALVGSPWCAPESSLALVCSLSFVSLLTSGDVLRRHGTVERRGDSDA